MNWGTPQRHRGLHQPRNLSRVICGAAPCALRGEALSKLLFTNSRVTSQSIPTGTPRYRCRYISLRLNLLTTYVYPNPQIALVNFFTTFMPCVVSFVLSMWVCVNNGGFPVGFPLNHCKGPPREQKSTNTHVSSRQVPSIPSQGPP